MHGVGEVVVDDPREESSARVLPFFFGSQTLHLWPRLL
jgi:hypothetical protein